ncbi:alpha/beta hydrolase [Verticiella sediminum]|uniref:Alpha/beta hydrolase n=1 Tax=Verticiella sediminum TaxID=1247510 RepID=A0A556B0A5_9BURK|nr:alpha/beta hydrolase [Verticiella sediminum]TSH98602.1 alpha/beta hydrolase [Verticiella sediminum]
MRLQPIIVPGWNGSGPEHWQSRWAEQLARATRVEQRDWAQPARAEWVHALTVAIDEATRPPLLVAHSLGCITVAHLPLPVRQKVAGALLVAPADVERENAPPALADFAPIPRTAFPFPTIVVASTDDPYCPLARAEAMARDWGADFVTLANAGHINTASGLGDWAYGKRLLATLRRRCSWRVPVPVHRVAAMPAIH